MPKKAKPVDLKRVTTYPIRSRVSKLDQSLLARLPSPDKPLAEFFRTWPKLLKAKEFLRIAERMAHAHRTDRAVVWMMGAHPIKCGLSSLIVDLIKRKVITCVAMNGAAAIHDFELAFFGHTSEDVEHGLEDGSFGMAQETGEGMNNIINEGVRRGYGIGEALGQSILRRGAKFQELSILCQGFKDNVPVTVHIALGTDIIHQHPNVDGVALGKGGILDFRTLAGQLPGLNDGGVVINCGSAVIMPEVFLKALTIARNLGNTVKDFTAVNLDMIEHYRPMANVLTRPTSLGGEAYSILGHHEIMLPLLYSAILTQLKS